MSQMQHVGFVSHGAIEVDLSRGVDMRHDVTATKHQLPKEERIVDAIRTVVGTRYIDPLATIDVRLAL